MKKRLISCVLTAALALSAAPTFAVQAAASIDIGDYVQMGTYYGAPILWRCVDKDENGPLMLSDKIICIKPFDAEGTMNTSTGSHSRRGNDWDSNYWADSNMRSWLNSNASAGNVNWLCGNPPIEEQVWRGYNEYDKEAGFLTNFTQGELNAVKEVTQKSLLSYPEIDAGMAKTGTERHSYDSDIADVVTNYDTAYAEYVTDRMFLLDVKQVNAVYNNGNILGEDYYIGEPTAECVTNSEYKDEGYLETGRKWYYWLRSPHASSDSNVRDVYSSGAVDINDANYFGLVLVGVRPAFYLNLQSAIFKSGSGTENSPYTVEGTGGGNKPEVTPAPIPEIETDSEYSGGEDMINKAGIDVNNLLSNITVGTDKIRGPKISILKKDFYLFELDGKCSIKLGDVKIQFKADEKKNTIQFMGGYDKISESMSTGTSYSDRGEWTKAYNDLKSLYNAIDGGKLSDSAKRNFSAVYNSLKQSDTNLFLNIKGNYALYGEIKWDNGNIKLSEGGVILKASASGSIDPRIGGIFYGTVGITLDASGKFYMKFDGPKKPLAVNSQLTFEPALNVGIGAGSKKLKLYIEGGLKGKLPIDIAAVTGSFADGASVNPLKVTLKGCIYVSGKLGIFGADKEFPLGDGVVLYPGGNITLQSIDTDMEGLYTFDKSDFSILPRDYAQHMSVMSLNEEFDKRNLYPYSTPQIAELSGGRRIILWIDDDPSKSDADRTSIYYSIYADGAWSAPEIAAESIGYNDMPQICQNGDDVYIAWTRVDEALGDTADMDDMMSKLNLYYMHFDGEQFEEPELVSEYNNGFCEMLYDIGVSNGSITVAWVQNSQNDFSLSEGTNYIYKRILKDGVWSDAQMILNESRELHDIQIDGNGNVIYEMGNNGVSMIYRENELIGESQNDNAAFQILDDTVYYLSGSEMTAYNINTSKTETAEIGEITDITVLNNGNEKIALSLLATGFTNELYQNEYKDGKWGEWTQLTSYNRYIRDYSAVVGTDGELTVVLNLVDVKDEEKGGYGDAELKVVRDMDYSDLILNNAYYDGEPAENKPLNICIDVTNNSRSTVSNAVVNISDASGTTLYSGDVTCDIAAGKTEVLTAPITIPSGFTKQDLTVNVSCGFDEADITNNSSVVTVGFADIKIEKARIFREGASVVLKGAVKNSGFENADNAVLKICDSDADGTVWDTVSLGSIPGCEAKEFSFTLPEQYLRDTGEKTSIYLEVSTDSEELQTGDNSDRVVMADLSDMENISEVSMSYKDGMLTVKSPEAMGACFIVAYYDADGSLIACRKADLSIGIGTNNIAIEGLTTGENVKLMLWDGTDSMKPLVESVQY